MRMKAEGRALRILGLVIFQLSDSIPALFILPTSSLHLERATRFELATLSLEG